MFKLILVTDGCDISTETALRWTSMDHSDDKLTLVQVMAWCRQATGHCLNQCWPRSLPPYGVTRPQWVEIYVRQWIGSWLVPLMIFRLVSDKPLPETIMTNYYNLGPFTHIKVWIHMATCSKRNVQVKINIGICTHVPCFIHRRPIR